MAALSRLTGTEHAPAGAEEAYEPYGGQAAKTGAGIVSVRDADEVLCLALHAVFRSEERGQRNIGRLGQ